MGCRKNFAAKCKNLFEIFFLSLEWSNNFFVTAWCNQSMCTMHVWIQPICIIKYAVYLFNGFFLAQCYLFRVRHLISLEHKFIWRYIHACNTLRAQFLKLHLYGCWWREWIKKEFNFYIYIHTCTKRKKEYKKKRILLIAKVADQLNVASTSS